MSFNWELYVELARELLNKRIHPDEQACLRTVLSRAYYGAYCSARDFLTRQRGDISKEKKPHEYVRNAFQWSSNRDAKQIGADLARLWQKRKHADYEASLTFDFQETQRLQQSARKIIDDLAKLTAKI